MALLVEWSKEFGDFGHDATREELDSNPIDMNPAEMFQRSEVTPNTYKNGMSYLMILKHKQTRNTNARGCASGQPQHKFIFNEESSLSMLSIYTFMVLCAMD